jgi:Sulfotransferase family
MSSDDQPTPDPLSMDVVFLVGCPRSGTTLLQRMLDAHPLVAVAPETFFIHRFWRVRDDLGDLSDNENYNRVVQSFIDMPEFTEMNLDPSEFRQAAQEQPRSLPTLFALLLHQFRERRNATIIGEKTPSHLHHMITLKSLFPRARFIHIIRDPRAVVNSWQHVPWSGGSVDRDAIVWRREMTKARNFTHQLNPDVLTIHYEELATNPNAVLQNLCRFLAIPFDDAMSAYHQSSDSTVNVQREPWKANAINPIDPTRVDLWKSALTAKQIQSIEAAVWPELTRNGYTPLTGKLSTIARRCAADIRRSYYRAANRIRGRAK